MNTKLNHIQNWPELAKKANWFVCGLAKECNVSIRVLELFFAKNFRRSPKDWLSEQRHSHAIELLMDGSCVKEVAAQLGYKMAHHFSRDFKKHCGHCPSKIVKGQLGSAHANLRVLV